jgi:hypothetical protein
MVSMGNMHKNLLKPLIMENLKELELTEMVEISGGVNVAYEVGYAVGKLVKRLAILKSIFEMI